MVWKVPKSKERLGEKSDGGARPVGGRRGAEESRGRKRACWRDWAGIFIARTAGGDASNGWWTGRAPMHREDRDRDRGCSAGDLSKRAVTSLMAYVFGEVVERILGAATPQERALTQR